MTLSKGLGAALALCLVLAVPVQAEERKTFSGFVDFKKQELSIKVGWQGAEKITAHIFPTENKRYRCEIDVEHLKTGFFDLSTKLAGDFELAADQATGALAVKGNVKSQYTLINYQPVKDLDAQFVIKDRRLYVNALTLGGLSCKGTVYLGEPSAVNLSLVLKGIAMRDFLAPWSDKDSKLSSAGLVSGTIDIFGTSDKIALRGSLSSYDGYVDDLTFDSIVVNVDGFYPVIVLSNSSVTKSDGYSFQIAGPLDLSKTDSFRSQIGALEKTPTVSSEKDYSEWTIKKKYDRNDSSATELKYLKRKDIGSGGPTEESTDMFGVQRSMKF